MTARLPTRSAASLLVTGTVRNLFNEDYADPSSDEHRSDSIEQTGRTLRLGLRWTIGGPR